MNASTAAPLYISYLGGTGNDDARTLIRTGEPERLVISGIIDSANFPVSGSGSAIDASCGPPCNSNNWDSFLTVVNSTTGAREVSTFVGGDDWEFPGRLARDRSAIAFSYLYQGGQSYSANFPPVNALQATRSGDADATFSIYRLEGNALERVLSTFIGGPGENEIAYGVEC